VALFRIAHWSNKWRVDYLAWETIFTANSFAAQDARFRCGRAHSRQVESIFTMLVKRRIYETRPPAVNTVTDQKTL
jgi:hypothetical protein